MAPGEERRPCEALIEAHRLQYVVGVAVLVVVVASVTVVVEIESMVA